MSDTLILAIAAQNIAGIMNLLPLIVNFFRLCPIRLFRLRLDHRTTQFPISITSRQTDSGNSNGKNARLSFAMPTKTVSGITGTCE